MCRCPTCTRPGSHPQKQTVPEVHSRGGWAGVRTETTARGRELSTLPGKRQPNDLSLGDSTRLHLCLGEAVCLDATLSGSSLCCPFLFTPLPCFISLCSPDHCPERVIHLFVSPLGCKLHVSRKPHPYFSSCRILGMQSSIWHMVGTHIC